MYGQHYEGEPSQVQEEYDPKVYGESVEKKLQSIINSIGGQFALLLMAVGDCIVNKKSQAEIAKKYNIPRSRVQWAVSGKREHKKGGKQYWQERKNKTPEEDSTISSQNHAIEANHCIAQLILEKVAYPILCEVPQMLPTECGANGFGLTGK